MRMPISAIRYAPSMVFLTPSFLPLVTICSSGVPPFFPCFSPGLNYHLGVIFRVIQVILVIFLFLAPKLSLNGPKSVHPIWWVASDTVTLLRTPGASILELPSPSPCELGNWDISAAKLGLFHGICRNLWCHQLQFGGQKVDPPFQPRQWSSLVV